MGPPPRLIDAARLVGDETNRLLDRAPKRIFHEIQLRSSVQSISANIREAYGRRSGKDRQQFLRFARASAEETDEHWRANYAARRIDPRVYWRLHHRLMTIIKLLDAIL
ncbi:MAG TPA: four helix bundle protein [Gemmatimonadaceae bacterium]|nr:four helix bundle protein [Gemmatimonadaceae bacterium]